MVVIISLDSIINSKQIQILQLLEWLIAEVLTFLLCRCHLCRLFRLRRWQSQSRNVRTSAISPTRSWRIWTCFNL